MSRFTLKKHFAALQPLFALSKQLHESTLEPKLCNLVLMRASQLNGCAYCLDMHSKDARAAGESEQRLYVLPAWRETPFYSARERAALAWCEALTRLDGHSVPNEIYDAALEQFGEEELIDLTLAVITINGYNRVNLAFPNMAVVGTYQPGKHAV